MKKISDFLSRHFYAIKWSACYIFIMWAILYLMFGFNMFSGAAWIKLSHSHLYGFGGFVFAILVLAAIPMYIATTVLIVRTGEPLFKIPVPNFIRRAFAEAAPAPATTPEPATEPAATPEADTDIYNLPDRVPMELRGDYIRARRGHGRPQMSAFDMSRMDAKSQTPVMELQPVSDFPLPTDFDISDPGADENNALIQMDNIPKFSEISFGDNAPTQPNTPASSVSEYADTTPVMEFLQNAGIAATLENDLIITKDMAIAIHNDPDFWVADDIDWFANGKQRPSPIAAIIKKSSESGLRPVMYLATTNILDLDGRIKTWQDNGIQIITDLDDLIS